ncbi:MAG: Rhodanese-related sulfurtransferase / Molybdopterin-synthase adenylyltransferase [uncultured Thermomicrobiales bacterium]|uniref:Rhodanese-related sulfurtransferase / Molybdopterin-synthase adenylyltransferase n=1 Tax=uncultured Thermomicrobiales bacterium TaxID=1645740 RepID=A0A6J4UHI3_9BACT|nr:MAG: Rhodanese-related sulfurtransferase / Molybdopterin-synthase adenylyltransferase [uncultured Thermomicrobiales bacterium]
MTASQPGQQIPNVPEVDVDGAQRMIDEGAIALDVREPNEFAEGVIPGAVLIPRADVPERIGDLIPDPSTPIVVYCAGGVRSAFATRTLEELGYTGAVSLAGGFNAWGAAGKPTAGPQ